MRYFYLLLPLILFINTLPAKAQNWSTPVNVSNMGKHCNAPRMIVDHNRTIHAVWSLMLTQQYRKIMYSKSETQGDTWTVPVAIADDSLQWFALPDIACDLQNRLYVAFEGDAMDPSNSLIYMVVNDGAQWGSPFIVSENFYGSMKTKVISDNTGRIYCFWDGWYANNSRIIYRFYENSVWSGIIIPYPIPQEYCFLTNLVVDRNNNLHCVGHHHLSNQGANYEDVNYFSYLKSSNQWSSFEVISDTLFQKFIYRDIDLDSSQVPHFVWRQNIHKIPSNDNATLSRYPNESGWLPVDSVEVNYNSYYHQFVIDNNNFSNISVSQWIDLPNNVHISYLKNYRQINNSWVAEIIDTIIGVFFEPNLIKLNNNEIGIIYYKGSAGNYSVADIYFSKYNIFTNIKPNELPAINMLITPNPFTTLTEITYTLSTQCQVLLDIFDINGKLITRLTDQTQSPGKYCRAWQGIGANAKEVSKGLYFVRLQAGCNVYTFKIAKQ